MLNQKDLNLDGPQLSPRSRYAGIHEETNSECPILVVHICLFSISLPGLIGRNADLERLLNSPNISIFACIPADCSWC